MKNLRMVLFIFSAMTVLSGCSKSCKINDCKEAVYKDGLCQEHYNLIQGSLADDGSVGQETVSQGPETTLQEPVTTPQESESTSEEHLSNEYLLPESDSRYYTEEELSVLTNEELRLARNEIYARHGRKFTNAELQAYFSAKPWYTPVYEADDFDAKSDSLLNKYEKANRDRIVSLENGGNTQGTTGGSAIDDKGNYQIKGEEYVWVDKYYMQGDVLYIEGTYCDGVWNPDADVAGDSMTFTTIKEHVTIMMDAETRITLEGCKDLKDVTSWIDRMAAEFGETAVAVKLDGAHVTEFSGTWQWS